MAFPGDVEVGFLRDFFPRKAAAKQSKFLATTTTTT